MSHLNIWRIIPQPYIITCGLLVNTGDRSDNDSRVLNSVFTLRSTIKSLNLINLCIVNINSYTDQSIFRHLFGFTKINLKITSSVFIWVEIAPLSHILRSSVPPSHPTSNNSVKYYHYLLSNPSRYYIFKSWNFTALSSSPLKTGRWIGITRKNWLVQEIPL